MGVFDVSSVDGVSLLTVVVDVDPPAASFRAALDPWKLFGVPRELGDPIGAHPGYGDLVEQRRSGPQAG